MRTSTLPVNLPQRSVLEEYRVPSLAGNGSFSNGSRQPSAGRRPEKAVLPDFPPKREDAGAPKQGPIPAGYGGGVFVASASPVGTYNGEHQRAAGSTTAAYASSGTSSGRSTSVPRPTSRNAPAPVAAGPAGPGGAPAPGASGRNITRPIVPGSILDSLRQPSVIPSIASLAHRTGNNSGWDYSSLAGASASSLRLKRQVGLSGDLTASAGASPSPVVPGQAEQLRAVYTSGPLAGTSGPPAVSASSMAAGGPGRRTSIERVVSRAGSFSAASPQQPSTSYATQDAPQLQPRVTAGGTVYASQYAPQYGTTASTVYIPYSSQQPGAGAGAGAHGAAGAGPQAGCGAGAGGPTSASSAYYAAAGVSHSRPPSLNLSAAMGAGGSGAGSMLSPSSGGASALQPLLSPTPTHAASTSSSPQLAGNFTALAGEASSRLVHCTNSGSALTRTGSLSSTAGGAGASAAAASILMPAGGVSRLRAVSTAATGGLGEDGAAGSADSGGNTSFRRVQLQEEQYRRSGNGAAAPPVAPGVGAGGSGSAAAHHPAVAAAQSVAPGRSMSPRPVAPYTTSPSAKAAPAAGDPYHHSHPHAQSHYSTLPAGATLDAGGSSYSSTTSTASTNSSTSSSKSSAAAAGGTGVSSVSTSRTTSSISARSAADAVQAAAAAQHAVTSIHRAGMDAGAGAAGQPRTLCQAASQGEKRQAASGTHAPVAAAPGADECQQELLPVCGPLPDLPVVVAPRDAPPGRGCVGLQNLGNTCFMNSILQSLNAVPELVQQFLAAADRHCWSPRAVVAPAYSALVRDMMAGLPGGCVNPSTFLRKLAKHDGRWGDGRQQDSQEFLNSLLEVLQSECNRITCKPAYRELQGKGSEEAQAAEAYTYARTWHDSIVDDIFGGLTQSTIQCHACRRLSHTFEPFLGLALPIPGPPSCGDGQTSVADCLRAFVECEELDGDDSYKCEACKRRQAHSKRLQVFRPPRVLVLTLKRFAQRPAAPGFLSRFRSPAKNATPVRLEPELDLTPYCNPLGLRGLSVQGRGPVAPVYQLVAVSHHSGSLDGGHYTAQARSCLDGQWYNFNDSSVRREAGRPSGASSSAYVLFYRLATLPPSSL